VKLAMMKLAAVAAGGALGASLRYLVASLAHGVLGHDFPYGTLIVNVIGSLIIGYMLVLLPEQEGAVPMVRLLLITGVLGGFTTYSAFSVETLQLMQEGHLTKAGLNIGITLASCFLAVWAGYLVAEYVHNRS
jgi:CrcB protein